jgi:cation transport regulator ChaC
MKTYTTQHLSFALGGQCEGCLFYMPMTEQQIQTKIKRKLIERGWYVTKLIKTSTNGIPDLLAIKYGKAMFIEVKREGGKLSPIQELRIEELKAAGAIVKVWTDYDFNFKKIEI